MKTSARIMNKGGSMAAIGNTVVEEFCKLCDKAYEVWVTHRTIEDYHQLEEVKNGPCGATLFRFYTMSTEYTFQQIAKLHDPAKQGDCFNLTLDYMIRFGGWQSEVKQKLESLLDKMNKFVRYEKPDNIIAARNKLISHNDRDTILRNETMGSFEPGQDKIYFEQLQQFVKIVHENTIGGPFLYFDNSAVNDANIFLEKIPRSWTSPRINRHLHSTE